MLFTDDDNPSSSTNDEFQRIAVPYEYKSEKFHFQSSSDYSKQYCHVYTYRLSHMIELLEKRIQEKWGDKYPIKKICDLRENNPEECVVIGTLYKHQELKPSVLRDISESHQLAPPPPRHHFFADDDKLIFEDDLQRILLVGDIDVHHFVTGVVCAILDMGFHLTLTFIFTFAIYLTYYSLISGQTIDATKTNNLQSAASITNEQLPKVNNAWVRTMNKRFRSMYGLMPLRRPEIVANYLPDTDMVDDNDIDKRFEDYGHMRFGKRGGIEGEISEDYGHMRYG